MFRWQDVARTGGREQDPMLEELVEAIDEAQIREAPIPDPDIVFGECDHATGTITINTGALRVAVALHELIHHCRPEWSERSVRARTTRVLNALTDAQIAALDARLLDAMRG